MSRLMAVRGLLVLPRRSAPVTPVLSGLDTFDGTGSDLGPGWVLFRGTAERIDGQATSPASWTTTSARKDFSVGSPNMAAEVNWVVGDPGQDRSVGVYVRLSDTAETGYFYEVNDAYDRYTVQRVINGVSENISNGFQALPSGIETPGVLRAEVRDDDAGHPVITCYWRGSVVGRWTDSSTKAIRSGTRGGLRIYNGGRVVRLDSFDVEAVTASAPPAAQVYSYGFDGTGTGLDGTWRDVVGSGFRDSGRASSAARQTDTSGVLGAMWVATNDFEAPTTKQFTQVSLVTGSTADRSAGVLVRAKAGRYRGYLAEVNDAADRVNLLRANDDGTFDGLTGYIPITGGVNPPGVLRLEVWDDTSGNVVLNLSWAGKQVRTFTDSSAKRIRDGACGGFTLYNPASSTMIDDFSTGGF